VWDIPQLVGAVLLATYSQAATMLLVTQSGFKVRRTHIQTDRCHQKQYLLAASLIAQVINKKPPELTVKIRNTTFYYDLQQVNERWILSRHDLKAHSWSNSTHSCQVKAPFQAHDSECAKKTGQGTIPGNKFVIKECLKESRHIGLEKDPASKGTGVASGYIYL